MSCALDFAKMASLAFNDGSFEQAVYYLTASLQNMPPHMPELAAKLLKDRCDCHWELRRRSEAFQDMKMSLKLDPFSKIDCTDDTARYREAEKWMDRGTHISEEEDFTTACECFTFAIAFSNHDRDLKSSAIVHRATVNYKMGKVSDAKQDISMIKRINPNYAKREVGNCMSIAKLLIGQHDYNKAIMTFNLGLEFCVPGMVEVRVEAHEHLAFCHFTVKSYDKALQSGSAAHKITKRKSLTEARKWKERGKELFKASKFNLLEGYYTLALNYAPSHDKELVSQLLCNRSLGRIKCSSYKAALDDAKQCVKTNPSWSKGHYRLGSCLSLQDHKAEAMKSFAVAYDLSGSDEEKYDAFTQMMSVAAKHDGDVSKISLDESSTRKFAQRAVDEAIKKEEWKKVWVLFLGGFKGKCRFCNGGIATYNDCNASACDLAKLIKVSVPKEETNEFVDFLIDHGAKVDGLQGSEKSPLLCAMETEDFEIASVLLAHGASLQCLRNKSRLHSRDRAIFVLREAEVHGDHGRAIELFQLSLELTPSWLCHIKHECYKGLADLHFTDNSYARCIEAGKNARQMNPIKNTVRALTWRERGNQIFKKKCDLQHVVDYYTLALEYTPQDETELVGALLSNRCLAYINSKAYNRAVADAKKCVASRPGWFKGYIRLGSCLVALGKHEDALKACCDGYRKADTNEDRLVMASQIITCALNCKDGGLGITCKISKPTIQQLIKDVCTRKEWQKLHLLFLGGDSKRNYSKGRGGLATGCDASAVPLNQLLECRDLFQLEKLIAVLLDHGGRVNGLAGCKRSPLAVALDQEQYGIATTLLKHHADASAIGSSSADKPGQRENQHLHWKDLAVRAYSAKDYGRAVKLLNLALQFASTAMADFRHQVHTLLATSYFELKSYEKTVESGSECFRLKPFKSQIEASKWKDRGKVLFREQQYNLLLEYYSLAIKYVPSNDKEFLATLLCNRSIAHYSVQQYPQGLEDAKSCSRFRPEWYKGYVRQGFCHVSMDQNREAVRAFTEGLKRAENSEDKYIILCQMVACAVSLPDGISSLVCNMPIAAVQRMVKEAGTKQDWAKLEMLYLGGGGPKRFSKGEGGIATGTNASAIPIELLVGSAFKGKAQLITSLLEHGANPDGLGRASKPPLLIAYENEEYGIAVSLLQHNAVASAIVTKNGGTPLHEAYHLAVTKGKFYFLRSLVEAEGIDLDAKDGTGNTLLHLAAMKQQTKRKSDAMQMALDNGANPSIKNNELKQPLDYLGKKDPRAKLLRTAINAIRSGSKKSKKKKRQVKRIEPTKEAVEEPATSEVVENKEESTGDSNGEKEVAKKTFSRILKGKQASGMDPMEQLRCAIVQIIDGVVPEDLLVEEVENEDEEETDDKSPLGTKEVTTEEAPEDDDDDDDESDHEDVAEEGGALHDGEPDAEPNLESPFENLPWEVDCTDVFWKALQSTDITKDTKRRAIAKICMLAQGRWPKKLCRRISGAPREHGMFLFKARVSHSAWIIWELSVAFSARCSENPEIRVQENEGRVYSEIIRVWDMCTDYASIAGQVERIVKSHDRGLNCIVKKELQRFRKTAGKTVREGERFPSFYTEVSETVEELLPAQPTRNSSMKVFIPPASPNDQEYHILKFYAFSSALVNSILHTTVLGKIDFPFRVTELEHAIINLRPNPPRAIILLGRSGTGKTTCCLYRLWNEFRSYWEKATTAGPHMPKMLEFLPRESDAGDEDGEGEEEEQPEAAPAEESEEVQDKEEEFIRAADARRRDREEGEEDGDGLDEDEEDDADDKYEHLHQVFVTKNAVLCTEVRKNFRELSHACPAAQEHVAIEDNPLPQKLDGIEEAAWPLFVHSRALLLLMDASIGGPPFFPRAEDGSLLRKIAGWGEEDKHLTAIEEEFDSDGEDEDEARVGNEQNEGGRAGQGNFDPRREVTYAVFAGELWPRICKRDKTLFHPTLLWTEIRSFIKGSVEALHADKGYLSLQEYQEIGRKRAPNFSADRSDVYSLFQIYQRVKSSSGMFDEADVVYHLYTRLQKAGAPDWSIHRIYVDETQDFTQAELSLLIRCCRDPNGLFFTGDTAQSIMRGIAFRFSDLKSLFYYAQQSYHSVGIQSGVRVPDTLYQLTHNYRSHAGILKLASCVVDLLLHFFPESFDKMKKDQGLFEGPRPVLLESCSFSDLAMILQGNRRHSSRIEFGAHQVILVASEEARDSMPDELKHGLVMTIYEAKGLEFDDVLIYNFFKDSQARKEWRVVSSFVKSLEEGKAECSSGLVELTDEDLTITSRPLKFDEGRHKVLNSEFKYLYTAITRARVNVWFFDEDDDVRAPMFEYFQRLGLVRVVRITEETDTLSSMFVEKSTEAEWRRRGQEFYHRGMWEVAIKCFTFSGDTAMIQKSQAHLQAAKAHKLRPTPKAMRTEYLLAAHQFLQCAMLPEAVVCLRNAKERILLAQLLRKLGKYEDAAKLYAREQTYLEASDCYETISDYYHAVEVLCQGSLYKEAIDAVERYNSLAGTAAISVGVRPPKASRTVERLCHQLAEEHCRQGRLKDMVAVLNRMPSADDKITFLQSHGCVEQTVEALVEQDRYDEAAKILKSNGCFFEAAKYTTNEQILADCFISSARFMRSTAYVDTEESAELVCGPLERALELFTKLKNKEGEAEVKMLMGGCKGQVDDVSESRRMFYQQGHVVGELDASVLLFEVSKGQLPISVPFWTFLKSVEKAFEFILTLHKPTSSHTNAELRHVELCEEYYGLEAADSSHMRCVYPRSGNRFACLVQSSSNKKYLVEAPSAYKLIADHTFSAVVGLVKAIRHKLKQMVDANRQCRRYRVGIPCLDTDNCKLQHCPVTKEQFSTIFNATVNAIHLNAVIRKFLAAFEKYDRQHLLVNLPFAPELQDFKDCRRLYDLLFPTGGQQGVLLTRELVQQVRRRESHVCSRLAAYAESMWKGVSTVRRWSNSDLFIQVARIMQLIGESEKMAQWLSMEVKRYQERGATPKCEGMMIEKSSGHMISFLSLHEKGRHFLHSYNDVLNSCFFTIKRYLAITACRRSLPVPSIANTVSIIEHQFTACLALFARLLGVDYGYPICLPESYLGVISFWDRVNCSSKKHGTLFEAVEWTAGGFTNKYKGIREVQSLLQFMVELVSGVVGHHFNVIRDAFTDSKGEFLMTGEAERTLVLALTMLCNCGKAVPYACSSYLVDNLRSLPMQMYFPSRIRQALEAVRSADDVPDIVVALEELLKSRKEKLYCLRWHQHSLYFDEGVGVAPFIQNLSSSSTLSQAPAAMPEKVHHDMDAPSGYQMPPGYDEEQSRQRELVERAAQQEVAAVKIQRWYRTTKSAKQEFQKSSEASAKTNVDDLMYRMCVAHFDKFKVDHSACSVCFVSFVSPTGEYYATTGIPVETYEVHVSAGSQHYIRLEEFLRYREWNLQRVLPLFIADDKLRQKVDAVEYPSGETGMSGHDFGLDAQRLANARSRVNMAIREFEMCGQWAKFQDLEPLLQTFETTLGHIEAMLSQDVGTQGGQDEKLQVKEPREDWDEDEPEELPGVPGRSARKSTRSRRKGGRNKKVNRQA